MNQTIKFYRGLREKYNSALYANAIYFAIDTAEIIVNDVAYGRDTQIPKHVSDVLLSKDGVGYPIGSSIVIVDSDGSEKQIPITDATFAPILGITVTQNESGEDVMISSHPTFDSGYDVLDFININFIEPALEGSSLITPDQETKISKSVSYDSISGNLVKSTSTNGVELDLNINYDSNNKQLIFKSGESEIYTLNTAEFVKDGMLTDVSIVTSGTGTDKIVYEGTEYTDGTKFIKFTWNTDAGESKVDYLKVDEIGKIYNGSTSITIDENNNISVKEVGDNLVKVTEDIQIAGGPLANNVIESGETWPWTDESGNKIIPKDKSIQEILTGLFLKVVNGTVRWGTASWSPSLGKPTATLSSNGPVEVGATVNATCTANTTVSGNTRSATCTTTQGYFDTVDGTHNTGNKTVSLEGSVTGTNSMTVKWNNTTITNYTGLKVVEGTNTLSVSQSGSTATVDALPSTTVYASTNTKTVLSDVSATLSDTKPSDKPLTSSASDTIAAYYPIFTNGVKASTSDSAGASMADLVQPVTEDGTKMDLVGAGTAIASSFASQAIEPYRIFVHQGKTLKSALAIDPLTKTYAVNCLSKFVKNGTTTRVVQGVTLTYDIYEWKSTEGANRVKFSLN